MTTPLTAMGETREAVRFAIATLDRGLDDIRGSIGNLSRETCRTFLAEISLIEKALSRCERLDRPPTPNLLARCHNVATAITEACSEVRSAKDA